MGRFAKTIATLALIAFCVWAWFAPYLTVESMRRAAQRGDAEAVAAHVDFPAVRDSLKRQMAARVNERIGGDGTLERLGAGIANAIAGPAIDAMVSPESLTLLFAGRDLHGDMRKLAVPPPADDNAPGAGGIRINDARITMGYDNLSTFTVAISTGNTGSAPTLLVFRRHHLLWWKLNEVVLPESTARLD